MVSYTYASQTNLVNGLGELLCCTARRLICIKSPDYIASSLVVSLGPHGKFWDGTFRQITKAHSSDFPKYFHVLYSGHNIYNAQEMLRQRRKE